MYVYEERRASNMIQDEYREVTFSSLKSLKNNGYGVAPSQNGNGGGFEESEVGNGSNHQKERLFSRFEVLDQI
jgi:hypothetical protein